MLPMRRDVPSGAYSVEPDRVSRSVDDPGARKVRQMAGDAPNSHGTIQPTFTRLHIVWK